MELLQELLSRLEKLDKGSIFMFKQWYEYRYGQQAVETLSEQDIKDCIHVAKKLGLEL